jgi:uncharacterized protein DUF1858/uncharacterized protein DUF2249
VAESGGEAAIGPETRIAELLERWPTLEDVLLALSPHFRALENPVVRRTVARVSTLRHAAEVAGIPLAALVARLREAAGLGPLAVVERSEPHPTPPWAIGVIPVRCFDVRAMVGAGGHPAAQVLDELAALVPGQVYELVTPFEPAPLVEKARRNGFDTYSEVAGAGAVRTYFRRTTG